MFSSKCCNAARIQKIWNLYKIINFRKSSGTFNKIATAGLLRAAEPWRFLRICQIVINWKWQKHSPHQFILSEIFQKVWVEKGLGSFHPPPPPSEVDIGLNIGFFSKTCCKCQQGLKEIEIWISSWMKHRLNATMIE